MSLLAGVRPRRQSNRRLQIAWLAVAMTLAAGAVILASVLGAREWHQPTFSGLDEQGHLDYVEYLSQGHLPRWGDHYTNETVRELNCLGIGRQVPQPCIENTDPGRYPPHGYSYEAQQPPVAYLLYVPFVDQHASPVAALDAARRGGVAWLAIAAALLIAMAWLADMTILQTALVLSVCLLSPTAIRAASTVTNDSAALAAGALCIVTVQVGRLRHSALTLPALTVGLAVGLTKALFFFVPVAILIGGLLTERWPIDRSDVGALVRRRGCELALLGGALAGTVIFPLVQEVRAATPSGVVLDALLGGHTTALPQWSTLEESVRNVFDSLGFETQSPLYTVWNLLLFGAVFGLIVNRRAAKDRGLGGLGVGAVVGMLGLAISFPLLDYFLGHFNFPTPGRYGLVFTPLLAYLAAKSVRPFFLVVIGVVVPALALISSFNGHPY